MFPEVAWTVRARSHHFTERRRTCHACCAVRGFGCSGVLDVATVPQPTSDEDRALVRLTVAGVSPLGQHHQAGRAPRRSGQAVSGCGRRNRHRRDRGAGRFVISGRYHGGDQRWPLRHQRGRDLGRASQSTPGSWSPSGPGRRHGRRRAVHRSRLLDLLPRPSPKSPASGQARPDRARAGRRWRGRTG